MATETDGQKGKNMNNGKKTCMAPILLEKTSCYGESLKLALRSASVIQHISVACAYPPQRAVRTRSVSDYERTGPRRLKQGNTANRRMNETHSKNVLLYSPHSDVQV